MGMSRDVVAEQGAERLGQVGAHGVFVDVDGSEERLVEESSDLWGGLEISGSST